LCISRIIGLIGFEISAVMPPKRVFSHGTSRGTGPSRSTIVDIFETSQTSTEQRTILQGSGRRAGQSTQLISQRVSAQASRGDFPNFCPMRAVSRREMAAAREENFGASSGPWRIEQQSGRAPHCDEGSRPPAFDMLKQTRPDQKTNKRKTCGHQSG